MADETTAQDIQTEEDLPEEAKQIIGELRGRYGRKIAVWYDDDFGLVVAARQKGLTGEANYNKLVNDLHGDEADKAIALRQFALSCVVYPAREQVKRIFEENPAFALKVAGRAQKLAGSGVKELGKA